MMSDNCPENIGNPDPNRLIYSWCDSFVTPRWVGEKAYKKCYHCGDNFKSGHQHHCRLCGEMFCSRCTSKYNIPAKYELKDKAGPTRVCYQCSNTCLNRRREAEGLRPHKLTSSFTVPFWQLLSSYVSCEKCRKFEKNPHNCRLCGVLHCDACSSKLDIVLPLEFNKKNKSGPHRVCDKCRYRYKAGSLIRGPNDPVTPDSRYTEPYIRLSKSSQSSHTSDLNDSVTKLSLSGMVPKFSLNSESEEEIPGPPPRVPTQNEHKTVISVKFAGKSTPIAVLEISVDGTLEDVYNALINKCPHLRNKNLQLIVRGDPVSKNHWDIVKSTHCRGELLISEIGVGPTRVMPILDTTARIIRTSNVPETTKQTEKQLTINDEDNDIENQNMLNIDNESTSAFIHAVFNSRQM